MTLLSHHLMRRSRGALRASPVPEAWLFILFALVAIVSLAASWLLVTRLERIGARVGVSEALLGMLAALAADGPEIASATTALIGGHARIGAGVVIGSNVFNLAALLGVGALVAGRIVLHRRVLAFEGVVAVVIAGICMAVVVSGVSAAVGVLACATVLIPYVVVSSGPANQRWLPAAWREWLTEAVTEEEIELAGALDHARAGKIDVLVAIAALLVVVGASVAMEQTASTLGARNAVPEIVVGGLVLAAVTSLPNAVSAVYLAARGRGAATLSTALNSNALNVLAGLMIPAAIVGLGARSGQTTLITVWYAGLTILALGLAFLGRGLTRAAGLVIVAGYAAFVLAILFST
jgi:cation:H+ antiporter